MATPGVETSDAPSGVTLLGRWVLITGTGFAVAEMTDAKALFGYAAEWSEFPAIEATPWWWTPKLAKSLTRPGSRAIGANHRRRGRVAVAVPAGHRGGQGHLSSRHATMSGLGPTAQPRAA